MSHTGKLTRKERYETNAPHPCCGNGQPVRRPQTESSLRAERRDHHGLRPLRCAGRRICQGRVRHSPRFRIRLPRGWWAASTKTGCPSTTYSRSSTIFPGVHRTPGAHEAVGPAHAIWCARRCVKEPFVSVNADDYYGKSAFKPWPSTSCSQV